MKGFTLLIAVVLASVALTVTLAITTFGYKSLVLASAAKESQYAFYAADAALECALYHDSGNAPGELPYRFDTTPSATSVFCAGQPVTTPVGFYDSATQETRYGPTGWFTINTNRCARYTVYKKANSASVYAEGTNVACSDLSNPRGIVRAIRAIY